MRLLIRQGIGILLFLPLQILFIPLGITGATMIFYRQIFVSKKLGVSSTAVEVMNGRWVMDRFGLRQDTATVQLFSVLPNTSTLGHWLLFFPLYVLTRISGRHQIYPIIKDAPKAGLTHLITTRTVLFDELLQHACNSSEQVVVMGAGFDTRSYGPLIHDALDIFELDKKETQSLKRNCLKQAGIDASSIQFVEVNFATEQWATKLTDAGYNPQKVTTFLWEGVSLYLSETDVRRALTAMQTHAAAGSRILVDFYEVEFVHKLMSRSGKLLELTNESLSFGIAFEGAASRQLAALASETNLKPGDIHYLGSETPKGTWMAVCELII